MDGLGDGTVARSVGYHLHQMAPLRPQTASVPETSDTQAGFMTASSDSTLSEALLVLRKRKWVLVATILLGLAYGFYQAVTQPVLYTAAGRIQVGSGATAAYRTPGTGEIQNLNNELLVLHSETLMLAVAGKMDLANNPAFFGVKGPLPHGDLNNAGTRQQIVGILLGSVNTAVIPGTQVISISCVSANPQLSADIVNHVMDAYIQRSYQVRFDSTQRVSGWLSGQLNDLKAQVETSQEQLIDMQRKMGGLGLSFDPTRPPSTESSTKVDALSGAVSSARIARILAESRYRTVTQADPSNLEGLLDATGLDGELNRLRGDIANTRATIAQDEVVLGDKNTKLIQEKAHLLELEREVTAEQNRLISRARDSYIAAKANEDQTLAALDEAKNQAYTMRDSLVEYTLRQREYETNRSLYDGLLSRLRAAGVQAGLESYEIDVIDPAQLPAAPTLKATSSILTQSGIFGLIGGIVLAFLLESLDTGLRSVAEIESVTQLPSLAVIPRTRRVGAESGGALSVAQSNIGVLTTSKSQFSEAFRSLRTSLLLATTGHPPKIIVITSATPSEGKTTVATNLACILAQRETRVLLIDSDLRRPNVHHRFGLNGRVGLSTVLSGSVTMDEALMQVPEVPNLDILCCGPVPPFPTEMLSSEAMHELLVTSSERYTHIVIDSPPILSVTDGVILSRQSDALAMVVRHGKSSRHVVRRARDLLFRAGAPVTGVVLNAVDMNAPEYYGYYGYSGYSYSNIDSESWEPEQRKAAPEQRAANEKRGEE